MEIKLSKNYTGLNRNIIYNLNTNNISTENRNIFWQNDNIRHLINYLNVNCNSLNDEYSKLIKSL